MIKGSAKINLIIFVADGNDTFSNLNLKLLKDSTSIVHTLNVCAFKHCHKGCRTLPFGHDHLQQIPRQAPA